MPKKELKSTGARMVVLAKSERFRNYLIGIGALTGLVLGLLAQFRGEPVAEKTWKTLREQVNKQSEAINQLHIRLESLQAVQEARTNFILEHELEDLQEKYEALLSGNVGASQDAEKPKGVDCLPGHVMADGRCRAVHTAVVSKVKQQEKKAQDARKELEEERTKRKKAERKGSVLMQQLLEQDAPEQKPLEPLPPSLEDAAGM